MSKLGYGLESRYTIIVIVAPRLNVIDELRIDYEIPYITALGEVQDHTTVQINERRKGVDISYALLDPTEQDIDNLFPSSGVDSLAQMTRRILSDLGIKPKRTILQLWEYGFTRGPYSIEGRAPVNKQRDTVLIILTKTPFVYKFNYELVLWHQATHAKDRWERRFPAAHPLVQAGEWLDVLWHFSIDGRLEGWMRPHYTKEERLEEAIALFQKLRLDGGVSDRARRTCVELWGVEVTLEELLGIGNDLGLMTNCQTVSESQTRSRDIRRR